MPTVVYFALFYLSNPQLMTDFKPWLMQLKTEKPELSDFITKLEHFFSKTGFD